MKQIKNESKNGYHGRIFEVFLHLKWENMCKNQIEWKPLAFIVVIVQSSEME